MITAKSQPFTPAYPWGTSGKPIATEAPYGYIKDPDNKDFWIIDE